MRVLSVDLGTSNTVAVLSAHGRPPTVLELDGSITMPSAVFVGDDGHLVVGREAVRRARVAPARFEPNPKRRIDEGTLLLGDRVVPVTEALAAVLRRVRDEVSRQLGGEEPEEVRLTHPAQWGPVRRNALLSAARQAGLGPALVLVPEPVAAAAHFASMPNHTLAAGQTLAVYDLGGGTFDVGIVGAHENGFVVLAEGGLADLGGLDIDHALAEHVGREVSMRDPASWQRLLRPENTTDRRAARAFQEDVRAAKEALSQHPQADIALPEPFHDVLVTRAELEGLVRPQLLRSVELVSGVVATAGLAPGSLAGIYLVGGASRMPLVAKLLAEHLGVVPTSLDMPEIAVALGAHHVPQQNTSMRTEVVLPLPPTPTAVAPSASTASTEHQSVAAPAAQVTHQPALPSKPFPQQLPQEQMLQSSSEQLSPQPFPSQSKPQPTRKSLLIGGLVLVVALAATSLFLAANIPKWLRQSPFVKSGMDKYVEEASCARITPRVQMLQALTVDREDDSYGGGSGSMCSYEQNISGEIYLRAYSVDVVLAGRDYFGTEAAKEDWLNYASSEDKPASIGFGDEAIWASGSSCKLRVRDGNLFLIADYDQFGTPSEDCQARNIELAKQVLAALR